MGLVRRNWLEADTVFAQSIHPTLGASDAARWRMLVFPRQLRLPPKSCVDHNVSRLGCSPSVTVGSGRSECQKGLEAGLRCGLHQCRPLAQSTRSAPTNCRNAIRWIADRYALASGTHGGGGKSKSSWQPCSNGAWLRPSASRSRAHNREGTHLVGPELRTPRAALVGLRPLIRATRRSVDARREPRARSRMAHGRSPGRLGNR